MIVRSVPMIEGVVVKIIVPMIQRTGEAVDADGWMHHIMLRELSEPTSALDRIVEAGGFITAATGGAPDANIIPIPKPVADAAMENATILP